MNDPGPNPTDPPTIDERLVAYLDRELSDEESEEIERRLAEDEALRDRVSGLDRVWNALDEAPRTTTDRGFADTTVAVVVGDVEKYNAEAPPRWPWRRALAALAGVLLGFLLVRGVSTSGDRQMISDLPAIRFAAALGQAEDEVYLRRILRDAPEVLSSVEPLDLRSEADLWGTIASASPSGRARWFAGQTEADREDLAERAIAFRAQSPARTRRLVALERRVSGDEQADRLRLAALSHHALLSVLPAGERAEFLSLPVDERVLKLKQNTKRWSQRALLRLTDAELAEFREGVLRIAGSASATRAIDRLESLVDRIGALRGEPRGRAPEFIRERFARSVSADLERYRQHPEQLIVTVAGLQARGDRPRMQDLVPNFPDMRSPWDEWEASLLESLPPRSRRTILAEKSPKQRARLMLDPLERVAAPARPGQISRYFAEELTNRELQDYLAMPVTEMQDKLRDRMAEESFGVPALSGRGAPGARGNGEPLEFRSDRDRRRGFRPPPSAGAEGPLPGRP